VVDEILHLKSKKNLNANTNIILFIGCYPGGKGTANMVKLAKDAGIEVREIVYEPT
jgi:hypothetical protein